MKNAAMLIMLPIRGRMVKGICRMKRLLLPGILILLTSAFTVQAGVKGDDIRPVPVRQHLLMDFGWRFALGNACDPSKDFGINSAYFSYFAKAGYGDGAVAYVNGLEVGRLNMQSSAAISYSSQALKRDTLEERLPMSMIQRQRYLKNGKNVIAVEMHSADSTRPTVSFDAKVYSIAGPVYYALGQEWSYYDKGTAPPDQVVDKSILFVDQAPALPELSEPVQSDNQHFIQPGEKGTCSAEGVQDTRTTCRHAG